MLAILLTALTAAPGCLTPEQRYRVLSFLFDGVPPPGGEEAVEVATARPGEEPGLAAGAIRPQRGKPPARYLHGPYAQRSCRACHEGRFSNRLVAEGQNLCWKCHERQDVWSDGKVVHGPTAAGMCVGCHNPHRSPNPLMLVAPEDRICQTCHDKSTFEFSDAHTPDETGSCLSCHSPHATARDFMLKPGAGPP